MGPVTGIAVFVIVWWTALFAVLPWGNTPAPADPASGNMGGAPEKPRLLAKFIATTALASVIWIVIYCLVKANIIDYHAIVRSMVAEDRSR